MNSKVIGKVYASVKSTLFMRPAGNQATFVMIADNGFRREFLGCVARCRLLEVWSGIGRVSIRRVVIAGEAIDGTVVRMKV